MNFLTTLLLVSATALLASVSVNADKSNQPSKTLINISSVGDHSVEAITLVYNDNGHETDLALSSTDVAKGDNSAHGNMRPLSFSGDCCQADLDNDGIVGVKDLLILLGAWPFYGVLGLIFLLNCWGFECP